MSQNQLEKRIQEANVKYRLNKTAVIGKVEVPILVTKTGLIPRQSTVDFTGIYSKTYRDPTVRSDFAALVKVGQGIAFDAKETENKTSFPLKNIHQHQLTFLEYFQEVGGTAFFIIQFKKLHPDHAFITPLDFVKKFWYDADSRRSIPYADFDQKQLVEIDDYLKYF